LVPTPTLAGLSQYEVRSHPGLAAGLTNAARGVVYVAHMARAAGGRRG